MSIANINNKKQTKTNRNWNLFLVCAQKFPTKQAQLFKKAHRKPKETLPPFISRLQLYSIHTAQQGRYNI